MAVERLTDYTRRIWTALDADAPEDHDIQVNDIIYYMDSNRCGIVTQVYPGGSIDVEFLPDVGGGGGGGTPESGSISYHTSTVRWAKVKTGVNTVTYTDRVLPYLMGLAGFSNTNNIATSFSIDPNAAIPYNGIGASEKIVYNYNGKRMYRYRSGSYSAVQITNNYDAVIPADTFYYVFVIEEVAP